MKNIRLLPLLTSIAAIGAQYIHAAEINLQTGDNSKIENQKVSENNTSLLGSGLQYPVRLCLYKLVSVSDVSEYNIEFQGKLIQELSIAGIAIDWS